jgi:GxxExxY protein
MGLDSDNQVTERIIGAAIQVHRELGPGFVEHIYEEALCLELASMGVPYQRQYPLQVVYKGQVMGDMRLDLLIQEQVVVELKAVDRLADIHTAQVLSYLKAARLTVGLLINFNVPILTRGVKRIVHTPSTSSP